jgi:hypothetical protein
MGRKPLPPQRRFRNSMHAYLSDNQVNWLLKEGEGFSSYSRKNLDRDMAADTEYMQQIKAREVAEHLREFETVTGRPFGPADLEAVQLPDEDPKKAEKAQYLALWQFFAAKRPDDVCKTIMGTAYDREILADKQLLDVITPQMGNFNIVDSPGRVLEKLRQYVRTEKWTLDTASEPKSETKSPGESLKNGSANQ